MFFRNPRLVCHALLWTVVLGLQQHEAHAQRLHLIIAANVIPQGHENSPKRWEEAINEDALTMEMLFRSNVPEERLNIVSIPPTEMESQRVLNYIRRIPVTQHRDTVVFYYSGHGGRDRERRPYFSLNTHDTRTNLQRLAVHNAIRQHQPRLTVVVSDTCYRGPTDLVAAPLPPAATAPGFQALFFDANGLVDITSSQPGELSYTDVFTPVLVDTLAKHSRNSRITWIDLFEEVRRRTTARDKRQTPFAFRLPGIIGYHLTPALMVRTVHRGSAAEEAGVVKGDNIISVNGRRVYDLRGYDQAVAVSPNEVRITVRRNGSERTLTIRP